MANSGKLVPGQRAEIEKAIYVIAEARGETKSARAKAREISLTDGPVLPEDYEERLLRAVNQIVGAWGATANLVRHDNQKALSFGSASQNRFKAALCAGNVPDYRITAMREEWGRLALYYRPHSEMHTVGWGDLRILFGSDEVQESPDLQRKLANLWRGLNGGQPFPDYFTLKSRTELSTDGREVLQQLLHPDWPKISSWKELTLTLKSKDSVQIKAGGFIKRFTFSELGFKDRRRGDMADQQWGLLCDLIRSAGDIDDRRRCDCTRPLIPAVHCLNRQLKRLFLLTTPPVKYIRRDKVYRAQFHVENHRADD